MDEIDKRILEIIQSEYPITSRPYEEVAKMLGLSEDEVFDRVVKMQKEGIIRRIGASFHSRKLGWKSTLCAASVPKDKLDDFVKIVNQYPGVTHNYLRRHKKYNIWFTYIGPSWESIERDIQEISKKTGIKILNLPAVKILKIKVEFPMNS